MEMNKAWKGNEKYWELVGGDRKQLQNLKERKCWSNSKEPKGTQNSRGGVISSQIMQGPGAIIKAWFLP